MLHALKSKFRTALVVLISMTFRWLYLKSKTGAVLLNNFKNSFDLAVSQVVNTLPLSWKCVDYKNITWNGVCAGLAGLFSMLMEIFCENQLILGHRLVSGNLPWAGKNRVPVAHYSPSIPSPATQLHIEFIQTSPYEWGRLKVENRAIIYNLKWINAHEQDRIYGTADRFCIEAGGNGTGIDNVCRKMGISETTFYNWKKKYDVLGVTELRELRQLQEENAKLKQIVAHQLLDKQMLQNVKKNLKIRQL